VDTYALASKIKELNGRNGAVVDSVVITEMNFVEGHRVPMVTDLNCWNDVSHGAGVLAFAEIDGICVECGLPELVRRIDSQHGGSFAVEVCA
jgi:hypothetical protein